MESRQNLAENLKKYRLRQNMKMDEFADYLGIGRTSLYELENMRVSCTLDTLDGIASHMGVPASMLLVKDMDPTQTPACAHIVDLCSCYMKLPMDRPGSWPSTSCGWGTFCRRRAGRKVRPMNDDEHCCTGWASACATSVFVIWRSASIWRYTNRCGCKMFQNACIQRSRAAAESSDPAQIERNLRTVIRICWDNGNRPLLNLLAGYTMIEKPSCVEFIDILSATCAGGALPRKGLAS